VPLFLMWLNLSWLIFLGGAAFAHAGAHREEMDLAERQEKQAPGAWDLLGALLAVAQQNRATGRPVELADVAAGLGLSQRATRGLLLALTKEGFICPVEGRSGAFLPARPLDRIGVWDVLRIGPSGDDSGLPRQVPVCEAMEKVRGRVRTGVEDLTIAAIMAD